MYGEREVKGYYGRSHNPCIVFVYTVRGLNWYAVEGSHNVNATYDPIELGVDVETLSDVDTASSGTPIETLEDLGSLIDEE